MEVAMELVTMIVLAFAQDLPSDEEILKKGKDALPMLREAMASDSKKTSRRALELMAKITGQWGSGAGILWKRSFADGLAESKKTGKPVILLQLFGKLDEEFC
jgi:hypothetical protein